MMNIITSNQLGIKDIKCYNDNFIISHIREKQLMPYANSQTGYQVDIYHQDGMSMAEWEDYEDTPDIRYQFHPVPSIPHALKEISQVLIDLETENMEKPNPVEISVVTVCEITWNHQAERYLNKRFREADYELTCLNLYRYMKIANPDKLTQFVKDVLQSEFVYPDDPVAYGYALMLSLGGVVI